MPFNWNPELNELGTMNRDLFVLAQAWIVTYVWLSACCYICAPSIPSNKPLVSKSMVCGAMVELKTVWAVSL